MALPEEKQIKDLFTDVFSDLFGTENCLRYKELKLKMRIQSDKSFMMWLLDIGSANSNHTIPHTPVPVAVIRCNGVIVGQYEGAIVKQIKQEESAEDCAVVHYNTMESDSFADLQPKMEATETPENFSDTQSLSSDNQDQRELIKNQDKSLKKYKCVACNASFKFLSDRVRHINNDHFGGHGLFPCAQCKRSFRYKCRLKTHIRVKHNRERTNMCELCGNKFFAPYDLRNHIERVHHQVRKLQCKVCDRRFVYEKAFNDHIQRSHLKMSRYVCDVCGKQMYTQDCLRHHIETHRPVAERQVTCDQCGKILLGKRSLCKHIWMVHRKMYKKLRDAEKQLKLKSE